MPLFRITVKSRVNTNGIRLEPGMSVEVVSNSFSDPVHTNGGQSVADAFMRIYGVDIKKAGALNGVYLAQSIIIGGNYILICIKCLPLPHGRQRIAYAGPHGATQGCT